MRTLYYDSSQLKLVLKFYYHYPVGYMKIVADALSVERAKPKSKKKNHGA